MVFAIAPLKAKIVHGAPSQDREPFEFDYCAGFPGYDDNPTSSDSAGSGSRK